MAAVDLKDLLYLDKFALDKELTRQSNAAYWIGKELAQARDDYESAKLSLEVLEARLYKDLRNGARLTGQRRMTEDEMRATIQCDPDRVQAAEEVIATNRILSKWYAAAKAIDHKQKALEGLVSLHRMDYYSKEGLYSEPRNGKSPEEIRAKMKEARSKRGGD